MHLQAINILKGITRNSLCNFGTAFFLDNIKLDWLQIFTKIFLNLNLKNVNLSFDSSQLLQQSIFIFIEGRANLIDDTAIPIELFLNAFDSHILMANIMIIFVWV